MSKKFLAVVSFISLASLVVGISLSLFAQSAIRKYEIEKARNHDHEQIIFLSTVKYLAPYLDIKSTPQKWNVDFMRVKFRLELLGLKVTMVPRKEDMLNIAIQAHDENPAILLLKHSGDGHDWPYWAELWNKFLADAEYCSVVEKRKGNRKERRKEK